DGVELVLLADPLDARVVEVLDAREVLGSVEGGSGDDRARDLRRDSIDAKWPLAGLIGRRRRRSQRESQQKPSMRRFHCDLLMLLGPDRATLTTNLLTCRSRRYARAIATHRQGFIAALSGKTAGFAYPWKTYLPAMVEEATTPA